MAHAAGMHAVALAGATTAGSRSGLSRGSSGSRWISMDRDARRASCARASGSDRESLPPSTSRARAFARRGAACSGSRARSRAPPSVASRGSVASRTAASSRDDPVGSSDDAEEARAPDPPAPASSSSTVKLATTAPPPAAAMGSSRVVEFVAAWDALSPRLAAAANSGTTFITPLGETAASTGGNREMLLSALKLAIPRLQMIPPPDDGSRPIHERAVEVTLALVDIGMDAECMSAGLLREALVAGTVTLDEVEAQLGAPVMRLAHDCARLHALPRRVGSLDDSTAEKLRTFCLSFHDVRAVVVELAYRVDALRNAAHLPAVRRVALALETMQLYAPMAHALDAGPLCAELEDLSLQQLFPSSYESLERWLRVEGPADHSALDRAGEWLRDALAADPGLSALVGGAAGIAVKARRKSLFSTMRKVLRDGRAREDVHDLLGMRVILTPQRGSPAHAAPGMAEEDPAGAAAAERSSLAACYRAQQIAHGLFDVVVGRTKDYLQRPKANGYRSLHSTLTLPREWTDAQEARGSGAGSGSEGRRVELQVRTAAMHAAAEMGAAAHTAYKGGFKEDPGAADALAELVSAANAAAEQRFGEFAESGIASDPAAAGRDADADRMFRMFDLDGDGRVTRDELRAVIGDVWAAEEDESGVAGAAADELVAMIDADDDGTVSAEEFARFRASLKVLGSLPGADAATKAVIDGIAGATREDDPVSESASARAESDSDDDLDDDFDDDFGAAAASYVTSVPIRAPTTNSDAEGEEERDPPCVQSHARAVDDAIAASAAAAEMAPPPLPPAPPPGRVRATDETLRDASRALKEKSGGAVEWQLVWDLMRAGRPETARELFYQRTSKTPGNTSLWEQWARFELLQGDAERARGLYRAALLHAEGRPRARAETLRKWGVMEFGAGESAAAAGLFERALNVLEEAEAAAKAAEDVEARAGSRLDGAKDADGDANDESDDSNDVSDPSDSDPSDSDPSDSGVPPANPGTESSASLRAAQAVVLHAWAQTESRAGDLTSARRRLAAAADRDASNPRVPHALAKIDEVDGDVDAARARYAAAAAAHPRDAHLALSRARLEWREFGDVAAAREIFVAAAESNPTNYRVLHAWGEMERRAGENSTVGLAASRPLFQRAADLAPWSPHVWCAWALAEWEGARDPDRARELYAEGLDAEPTNTACLRGLGKVERLSGRLTQARDYLERALDLEPRNRACVKELAMLEEQCGNAARAARYFNAAKQLGKEANATAKIKKTTREGTRGTWEPKEAAAAARGNAAVVASRGASYGSARARLGGEAGGGAQHFRAVLAATRGESAAARRDRGGGVARAGGAATRRRLVARTRADAEANAATKTTENAARAKDPDDDIVERMFGSRSRSQSRSRRAGEANGAVDVGSSLDSPPGSSLDSPPGSSLDSPPGTSLDAPELSLDGERDAVYASFDEFGSGTLDSADEELRRYLRE